MTEPIVELEGVHKWYGEYHAVRDVSLTVRRGERVVICGPSGSGKSTLIRLINQLEAHDLGSIRVAGEMLEGGPEVEKMRRRVGMVFQQFNLFPHLTVLENCTLAPAWAFRLDQRTAEARAMALLERVGMADHARKFPGRLSGGQQQRVAIARALAMEPEVMLFDEPTSALDPEMVKEVLDIMIQLAEGGMTMICVTHEMRFARLAADQVVFMDEGEIVEIDRPDRFFKDPRSPRARAFISHIEKN